MLKILVAISSSLGNNHGNEDLSDFASRVNFFLLFTSINTKQVNWNLLGVFCQHKKYFKKILDSLP